ncbi:MAG: efflux RND transporter periplasmic adaptor subunit [Proteobacteria bacterium]|nr:efflux RND transporter periplasmic adaptor subunit [Pseudomonadota bacterium]
MNGISTKIKNIIKRNLLLVTIIPVLVIGIIVASFSGLFTKSDEQKDESIIEIIKDKVEENLILEDEVIDEESDKEGEDDIYNFSASGIVEPRSEVIEVATNVAGNISTIYVKAGDDVNKGSALFTIDNREAKAGYELKNAGYQLAQLEYANAKKKLEELGLTDEDIEQEADKAPNDEVIELQKALKLARFKLSQARAELELARILVKKSTVRSPIDAKVLKVNINVGEYAAIGELEKPVMTIGDLSKMHIRTQISESDAHKIKANQKAVASPIGDSKIKIPVQLVRVEPKIIIKENPNIIDKINNANRVLEVIYGFDNSYNIVVGQRMKVDIQILEPQE